MKKNSKRRIDRATYGFWLQSEEPMSLAQAQRTKASLKALLDLMRQNSDPDLKLFFLRVSRSRGKGSGFKSKPSCTTASR